MHSPYGPDLTPSDYHQYLFMANYLDGEKFVSKEASENRLYQFVANRDSGFYEGGIMVYLQNMAKIYRARQCIFDTNRKNLNKAFILMQKKWIAFY